VSALALRHSGARHAHDGGHLRGGRQHDSIGCSTIGCKKVRWVAWALKVANPSLDAEAASGMHRWSAPDKALNSGGHRTTHLGRHGHVPEEGLVPRPEGAPGGGPVAAAAPPTFPRRGACTRPTHTAALHTLCSRGHTQLPCGTSGCRVLSSLLACSQLARGR
jgi:hypothetical protein